MISDFAYKDLFSRGLLQITEDGTLHLLYQRWWTPEGESCPAKTSRDREQTCSEVGTTKDIENMSECGTVNCSN